MMRMNIGKNFYVILALGKYIFRAFGYTSGLYYKLKRLYVTSQLFKFSPTWPHWAKFVIELPCPYVCLSVCLRHRVQFFPRPLIGPEVTWSVPGLSLVLPPSLLWKLGNLETRKLGKSETRKLGNSETRKLGNLQPPPKKNNIYIFWGKINK